MQAQSVVQSLLSRSAKLKLFAMARRTVKPEALSGALEAHLHWMIGEERKGRIFLSGPMTPREGTSGFDGLTVIHAATLAEAEALAAEDPFVVAGIVSFEMHEWTVNEGSLRLNVTLSDSSVAL